MRWAMLILAALCILIGLWPSQLYELLPYAVNYEPYTWSHVIEQMQLLLFAALAFFVMLPNLKRMLGITLDWDWLWRRFVPDVRKWLDLPSNRTWTWLQGMVQQIFSSTYKLIVSEHPGEAPFAATWSTRSMAIWVLVLLLGYLLFYFL